MLTKKNAQRGAVSIDMNLSDLPQRYFGVIYADPPWNFACWASPPYGHGPGRGQGLAASNYPTMKCDEICALPVGNLAADDCVLFLWTCWPTLEDSLEVIHAWGFKYKTCGFMWAKAHARQLEMFQDHIDGWMGLGYWTRSNSEVCLLATRGNPKRVAADVKQVVIEPAREHSRKPDCVHDRIERLVAGPYLELFARQRRPGWTVWGNEVDKFGEYNAADDFGKSIDECYRVIRERKAAGGPGWPDGEKRNA